jgi:hypothetical protein
MHLGEARENAGQPAQRVVVRRAEPHRPGDGRRAEGRDDLVMHGQQPLGPLQQPGAMRRRLDPTRPAQQQRLAERLLETADLHRDRGLRPSDDGGGTGEGPALGDQHEGAQQVGVDAGGQGEHAAGPSAPGLPAAAASSEGKQSSGTVGTHADNIRFPDTIRQSNSFSC